MALVYLIENEVNGKQYVGWSSRSVEDRWRRHVLASIRGNETLLYRAMRKHGVDNFTVYVLVTGVSMKEAKRLERSYIQELATFSEEGGYNMTLGGDGVAGWRHKKSTRKVLSEKIQERNSDLAYRTRFLAVMEDPAVKERHAKRTREAQQDPANRAIRSLRMQKFWATPKNRSRMLRAIRKNSRDPKHLENLRRAWSDPKIRAQRMTTARDPARREKMSKDALSRWRDPVYRSRQETALRRRFSRLGGKEQQAEVLRAVQERPGVKERQVEGVMKYWQDTKARERHSRVMKRAWARRKAVIGNALNRR